MKRQISLIGLLILAGLAAGQSIAQSGEARQTIRVLDAIYGQDQRICSVYQDVARQCDGREYCEVRASNALCGNKDPYRGVAKQLFVGWDCGDGRRSITVDQERVARIYCWNGPGGREQVDTVWRRGGDSTAVPAPSPLPTPSGDYRPNEITMSVVRYGAYQSYCDATAVFARECDRRASCSVRIDNNLCGDPREGARKRAYVTYQCNGEDVQVTANERDDMTLKCPTD